MKGTSFVSVVLTTALILHLNASRYAAAQKVTVAGSSTVRPVVAAAVREFRKTHPTTQFLVGGGGSSRGIRAACTEEVQIGMSSRDTYDSETASYPDIRTFTIGLDGIAIIVNSKNPVARITKEQVRDVYTGAITNWRALGGNDSHIALSSKEEGRSTRDLFLNYFDLEAREETKGTTRVMVHRKKGTTEYAEVGAKPIGPNRDALARVSVNQNAIAYVSLGSAQQVASRGGRLKLLELDGVAANVANVANRTYHLMRPLNVISRGEPRGTAKEFIDFLLGPEGQRIVASLDFIGVKQQERKPLKVEIKEVQKEDSSAPSAKPPGRSDDQY